MNAPSTQRQLESVVLHRDGTRGFAEGVELARVLDLVGQRIGWGAMHDMAAALYRLRALNEPVEAAEARRAAFLDQIP